MTKDQLITKQQIQIEEMKRDILGMIESFNKILSMMYAVGAPLNDNCLEFNLEQRDYLRKIEALLWDKDCLSDSYSYKDNQ